MGNAWKRTCRASEFSREPKRKGKRYPLLVQKKTPGLKTSEFRQCGRRGQTVGDKEENEEKEVGHILQETTEKRGWCRSMFVEKGRLTYFSVHIQYANSGKGKEGKKEKKICPLFKGSGRGEAKTFKW